MAALLSSFLKDFCELFLTAPILLCMVDECDRLSKNSMKTFIKWFRKNIFWINEIRHIYTNISNQWQHFVILLEGFSCVIPNLTHSASSGPESAKELSVFKMPPNKKFSSTDVDISFIAAL
jgi:hypothetical protein